MRFACAVYVTTMSSCVRACSLQDVIVATEPIPGLDPDRLLDLRMGTETIDAVRCALVSICGDVNMP